MAEEGIDLENLNAGETMANGADNGPTVGVLSQYVKDLSVENPNAPDSFNWAGQPQIDVSVNIQSNALNEEVHEVALKLNVQANSEKGVSFIVELVYCGLFGLRNVPEEAAHPFLFAEAPRIIFPFARRILADAVRDAGYPPLMLEPIDFNQLYMQQRQQGAGQPGGEQPPVGQA
ncbi:protein-export chaperone SecB [Novosphingopyxis sp. YJ-S2-01]|uniref:protein-export chaperone SecB n=1 Tax=Novosphingopyxis sp. YJ-S2-01 TaxID=2794021 RepID=UPI0018DB029E|nr:protein-export chaperone SecB [Novosphingopyxis sp. YJ-S2-01]MBH9537253.1 protein-export chaperone SecB [Novosphingopyxis sp. YJ-S2-01]